MVLQSRKLLNRQVPGNKKEKFGLSLSAVLNKINIKLYSRIHVQPKGNFVGQAIIIKGNPENCTNACFKILEVLQQKATNTRSR